MTPLFLEDEEKIKLIDPRRSTSESKVNVINFRAPCTRTCSQEWSIQNTCPQGSFSEPEEEFNTCNFLGRGGRRCMLKEH